MISVRVSEHGGNNDHLNQIPVIQLDPDAGALWPVFFRAAPLAPHCVHVRLVRDVTEIDGRLQLQPGLPASKSTLSSSPSVFRVCSTKPSTHARSVATA